MRASQAAPFPGGNTIVVPIGPAAITIPRGTIHRGVKYRVVSTQDCWFTVDGPDPVLPDPLVVVAITEQWSVYMPAKQAEEFVFGFMDPSPDAHEPTLRVIASFPGTMYFTPIRILPAQ
jgi:hypothetical protein